MVLREADVVLCLIPLGAQVSFTARGVVVVPAKAPGGTALRGDAPAPAGDVSEPFVGLHLEMLADNVALQEPRVQLHPREQRERRGVRPQLRPRDGQLLWLLEHLLPSQQLHRPPSLLVKVNRTCREVVLGLHRHASHQVTHSLGGLDGNDAVKVKGGFEVGEDGELVLDAVHDAHAQHEAREDGEQHHQLQQPAQHLPLKRESLHQQVAVQPSLVQDALAYHALNTLYGFVVGFLC
mmetsp:Transcript_29009/g.55640  ORF Transcript_29009/g.55640 Transcript_29009/m.55640 type:complete len:237 (+) Transcript_29009:4519-5229(+)